MSAPCGAVFPRFRPLPYTPTHMLWPAWLLGAVHRPRRYLTVLLAGLSASYKVPPPWASAFTPVSAGFAPKRSQRVLVGVVRAVDLQPCAIPRVVVEELRLSSRLCGLRVLQEGPEGLLLGLHREFSPVVRRVRPWRVATWPLFGPFVPPYLWLPCSQLAAVLPAASPASAGRCLAWGARPLALSPPPSCRVLCLLPIRDLFLHLCGS